MKTYEELAELIFPEIKETISDLEKRYPKRNVIGEVTRFAPSPTGFLHLGSLFTALVASKIARDSNGIFYTRLEDTDSKREVKGSGNSLISELKAFDIIPDEGYLGDDKEVGIYGPYTQSKRANIYKIVIKELLRQGKAYPCFCSHEDLDAIRAEQEARKLIPGYYGRFAKCRNLSLDEAYERIKNNEKFVIRFKSEGNFENKTVIHDILRGDIQIAENNLDVVIYKADGLPTYHFAHVVDDHFMRTSLVLRGEEWIASAPIHVEMFKALGFDVPKYAHLPVIMKKDGDHKRKLSKRLDKEASVSHYIKNGYSSEILGAYLMSIANSNFEEWTMENHCYDINKFKFSFEHMSLDGVLFDQDKLNYFGKEIIALLSAEELYDRLIKYSEVFDKHFFDELKANNQVSIGVLNIERGIEKARKDYTCYADIYPHIRFAYNDDFSEIVKDGYPFNESIKKEIIIKILEDFKVNNNYSLDSSEWFNSLKELGNKFGFASSGKEYKKNKESYLGHIGDVAEMIRIALVGSKISPNLYDVIQVFGKKEVDRRLQLAIDFLR